MIAFGDRNEHFKHAPFLLKAVEYDENCIRLTVSLACEGEKGSDLDDMGIPALGEILRKAVPIYPDENEVYEITFEQYILYLTRNESYCSGDDDEVKRGTFFVIYEKSRLLDMLHLLTDCQILSDGTAYPGEWKHYGIVCQNHIIDIVSHHEPTVRKRDMGG